MNNTSSHTTADATEFARNMAQASELWQNVLHSFLNRQVKDLTQKDITQIPFDPLNIGEAWREMMANYLKDPVSAFNKQVDLWQGYAQLWQRSTQQLLGAEAEPLITPDSKDRRFKDAAWQQSAVFDYLKQSYLLTARWMQQAVRDASHNLDTKSARKLDFYTRQFIDAMSPSNFLLTNPEVLKTTIETNGESLVRGLEHLLEDIERGDGALRISMTDPGAFAVGKNLAVTPGKVVFENDLMQLIQYSPTTKEVHKTPLLVMPAWINKYYILDLQPDNSMVKWLVDQGYTVFIISWVNPDARHSEKSFDDYMIEGPLAAMDAIESLTGEAQISVIAYCLGGTLLSITLAWLAKKGLDSRVKSATYLTTMLDFTEAGELSIFVDDEQLLSLESRMSQTGYLEGSEMALTFNMLRANDLIWSFVVNNYLLGKERFPFDLLYWNSDSTRMPAKMHSFYLRNMYQSNRLARGELVIAGEPIKLGSVTTPSYFLSTREDHIAPWVSTYAGTKLLGGKVRFVLAASGHIAGVINPPVKQKYSHWTNDSAPAAPEEWLASAKEQAGSWWPDWIRWHAQFAGPKQPARTISKALEDAPGSYVKVIV